MIEDRYTAEEIEAELYDGMPGDREFVLASDYDALAAELAELQRKLERYEAIKRADIETLHEFADHLAYKRALEEG